MFNVILPALASFAQSKVMMSAGTKLLMSTAAAGLGQALDQKAAQKKAAKKQANFYVNMRDAAQRAGFNPASVLMSGTAGAFQNAGTPQYGPLTSFDFNQAMQQGQMAQQQINESNATISNMKQSLKLERMRTNSTIAATNAQIANDTEYLEMAKDAHEHNVQNTMASTTLMTYQQNKLAQEIEQGMRYPVMTNGKQMTRKLPDGTVVPLFWDESANKTIPNTKMTADKNGQIFPMLDEKAMSPDADQLLLYGPLANISIANKKFNEMNILGAIGKNNIGKYSPTNWLSMQVMRALQ